jgi:RNA polymerase sigma-70 factor (ECF subfamily)
MEPLKHLSDNELTDLLRSGDRHAYTELFERYHKLLLSHAYRFLRDRDEAYDVVQEVLLALWEKRDTLLLNTSLSAYLFTAVKNRIFKMLAHEKVIERYTQSLNYFLDVSSPADYRLIDKELTVLIEKEIAALPAKMRKIFLLRRKDELDYETIGEQLHISPGAAKQQVYNAVKLLKLKISSLIMLML